MNQKTNSQTDPLFESELCAERKVSHSNYKSKSNVFLNKIVYILLIRRMRKVY